MRTVQGVGGMDASHGIVTLSHEKKRSRHGKRSTARRNSTTIASGSEGHMSELKPGDINEDGKELEQDGWITVWTDEIEIPPTETSEDE